MKPKFSIRTLALVIGFIFLHSPVNAHINQPKDISRIGIHEKLGQFIPLDLAFNDETSKPVILRQLIHTPTILALVYYHCPNVCNFLLQNLADVLNRLPEEPDKEYRVISVSFDEKEKPPLALQKKKTYLTMMEKPFPEDAWRFLTGDKENIRKLTDAVGFHFKRVGDDFEHPVSLIILAPSGKIARYMYGADPLPFDLRMALIEASQGKIGPAITKVVRFCFSYDPKANKLVFNTLRVTGSVTLLLALSFAGYLLFKRGQKIPKRSSTNDIDLGE